MKDIDKELHLVNEEIIKQQSEMIEILKSQIENLKDIIYEKKRS